MTAKVVAVHLWTSSKRLLREGWGILRQYRVAALLVAALVIGAALWALPHEAAWLHALRYPRTHNRVALAEWLSRWGDYPTGTFIVTAVVALAGWGLRRPRWRSAALACFLAASLAGLATNVVRLSAGRPRPQSKLPDGLYGPSLRYELHGFPSSHCGTAFGTATALAAALPALALPAVLTAGAVAWSRMYLNCHRPTDTWIGAAFGTLFGLPLGSAVRRRSRRRRREEDG